jgi:hypothetical protein
MTTLCPRLTASQLRLTVSHIRVTNSSESESDLSLTLRPTVRRPVCLRIKHPSGTYDQIFVIVKTVAGFLCGVLSLTRGRFNRLKLLLFIASAVIFGSESRSTRDHILLSQIWGREITASVGFFSLIPLLRSRCHGDASNSSNKSTVTVRLANVAEQRTFIRVRLFRLSATMSQYSSFYVFRQQTR